MIDVQHYNFFLAEVSSDTELSLLFFSPFSASFPHVQPFVDVFQLFLSHDHISLLLLYRFGVIKKSYYYPPPPFALVKHQLGGGILL